MSRGDELFIFYSFNLESESHNPRDGKPGADKKTHLPVGFTMDHPTFAIIKNVYVPGKQKQRAILSDFIHNRHTCLGERPNETAEIEANLRTTSSKLVFRKRVRSQQNAKGIGQLGH